MCLIIIAVPSHLSTLSETRDKEPGFSDAIKTAYGASTVHRRSALRLIYDSRIDYLGQNENVTINLDLIGRAMDLVRDRLDICITTEHHILNQANMQKIALGTYSSRLVASKQYILQHGEPKTFEDLKNHAFITGKEDSMSPVTLRFGDKEMPIIPKLSINRMDCVMQGVKAGLGIATALNTDPSLNEDDLITILDEYTPDETVLYLTYLDKNYISYLLEDCAEFL